MKKDYMEAFKRGSMEKTYAIAPQKPYDER